MKRKEKCATHFEQYGDNAKMMKPFVWLDASHSSFVCVQCTYSCDNSFLSSFMKCFSELVWFGFVWLPVYMLVQKKSRFAFADGIWFYFASFVSFTSVCDLLNTFHGISLYVILCLRAFKVFSLIYVRDLMTAAVHAISQKNIHIMQSHDHIRDISARDLFSRCFRLQRVPSRPNGKPIFSLIYIRPNSQWHESINSHCITITDSIWSG